MGKVTITMVRAKRTDPKQACRLWVRGDSEDQMNWESAAERIREAGLYCQGRTREPGGGSVTEITGGTEYERVKLGKLKGMGMFTGQLFYIFEDFTGQYVCSFDLGQGPPRAEHKGTLAEVVEWLVTKAV